MKDYIGTIDLSELTEEDFLNELEIQDKLDQLSEFAYLENESLFTKIKRSILEKLLIILTR